MTLDKKHRIAIGLKSEVDEGVDVFFIATKRDFFHAAGKVPFLREVLNIVINKGPKVGSYLAIIR